MKVGVSPRLPPPMRAAPLMASAAHFGTETGPAGHSESSTVVAAPELEALRAEAANLAKIRRDLNGGRGQGRPAAAGKLVSSSSSKAIPAHTEPATAPGAPPAAPWDSVAPWDPPSPLSSRGFGGGELSSFGGGELSTSVVPNAQKSLHGSSKGDLGASVGNGASCSSSMGTGLERQHLERRQLIDWGENLYQEVGKLEQEKNQLAITLAESQKERKRLESELDHMRRRCSELERMVRNGDKSKKGSPSDPQSLSENGELRKQLAAYAVEIDVLREERESGQRSLREAQEAVQHLTMEKDGIARTLQDLEHSHHQKTQHCEHLENLIHTHSQEKTKFDSMLQSATSEKDLLGATLQRAQERHTDTQRHVELTVAEAERAATEKDHQIAALLEVVTPLREQLNAMQGNFVQQTKDFHNFIKQVRQKQQSSNSLMERAKQSLEMRVHEEQGMLAVVEQLQQASHGIEQGQQKSVESLRGKHKDLERQLTASKLEGDTIKEEHQRMQQEIKDRDAEDRRIKLKRKERLTIRFKPNITRQMQMACHLPGILLQKVNEKSKKQEYRKVIICEEFMRLKWVKHPFKFGKGESFVNLNQIIQIGFGCNTRASVLFPLDEKNPKGAAPWLCFSVYTVERSYDFICHDIDEVESFVLSISRLCARLSGWSIPGSIHSHAQFVAATAWCKVEHTCRQERKTLCAAIIDAMVTAHDAPMPSPSVAASSQLAAPRSPRGGASTGPPLGAGIGGGVFDGKPAPTLSGTSSGTALPRQAASAVAPTTSTGSSRSRSGVAVAGKKSTSSTSH